MTTEVCLRMDELTEKLAVSFEVTAEPNKTSAPHPRYSQYKAKSSNHDQDSRRKRLLEIQKSQRFDFLKHVRNLTDDTWEDEDFKETEEVEAADGEGEDMEVQTAFKRPGRYYKDQLMYSEWLVEVPEDFETEWLSVLCPVAKRCLIVASRGTTRAFTKSGYCMNSFPSHLPGGSRRSAQRDTTLLDCLYSEAARTYYILDLMCWNGHTVYDSETEFRFYWLHEKMQEFSELGKESRINPYKFVALPSFRCIQEDIAQAVTAATFEIDGLLFFHKRTHYTFGCTPLVVWLKPYMLQEILGISTVPVSQMGHMPKDYTNYADYMKKVAEEREKQKELQAARKERGASFPTRGRGRGSRRGRGGRGRGHRAMDTADSSTQDAGHDMDGLEVKGGQEGGEMEVKEPIQAGDDELCEMEKDSSDSHASLGSGTVLGNSDHRLSGGKETSNGEMDLLPAASS